MGKSKAEKRIASGILCAYCGKSVGVTDDHVPPQGFFPEGHRDNLITVPCCTECNNPASKDEEYVRGVICTEFSAVESSDAARSQAEGPVARSWSKPGFDGLARLIANASEQVSIFSEEGKYVGESALISIDQVRFARVAEKIIRGLYYFEVGERLPDGYAVLVLTIGADADLYDTVRRSFAPVETRPPRRVAYPDVFNYAYALMEFDPGASFWILSFYRAFAFICVTVSPQVKRDCDQGMSTEA